MTLLNSYSFIKPTVAPRPIHEGFVASVYDGSWYVGNTIEHDADRREYNICFMKTTSHKNIYSFKEATNPAHETVWVREHNILCNVQEPQPCGCSRRIYKLSENNLQCVLKQFSKY